MYIQTIMYTSFKTNLIKVLSIVIPYWIGTGFIKVRFIVQHTKFDNNIILEMDPHVQIPIKPFSMLPPQLAQFSNLNHFAINNRKYLLYNFMESAFPQAPAGSSRQLCSLIILQITPHICNFSRNLISSNRMNRQIPRKGPFKHSELRKPRRDNLDQLKYRLEFRRKRKKRKNYNTQYFTYRINLKKQDTERLDEELLKRIEEEEKQALIYEKDETARREQMALQLMNVSNLQLEEAQALLIKFKWDYAAVVSKLKEEERRENLIYEAMGMLNMDYDKAKNVLMQHAWVLEAAISGVAAAQQSNPYQANKVNLTLIIFPAYPGPQQEVIKQSFSKDSEGMAIIEYLNNVRKLPQNPNPAAPPLYYRMFRDQQCTKMLSYIELTNSLSGNGIADGQTYYFNISAEAPF